MVTQSHRVEALEKHYAGAHADRPPWLEEGRHTAREALKQLVPLIADDDDETAMGLVGLLKENCGVLAWGAKIRCTSNTPFVQDFLNYPQTLVSFLTLTPADFRPPVVKALGTRHHPLCSWLHHIAAQASRLPSDLSPEVMVQLLRVYLDHSDDINDFANACDACGLEWPRRKIRPLFGCNSIAQNTSPQWPAEFFNSCPACKCEAWSYTHLAKK
jgi:hypothetical protein